MKRLISKLQQFRDWIRRIIGKILFDKKSTSCDFTAVKNILIIRWDAKLGDSYISSFFFREIKKIPDTRVTVLTTPELKDLYLQGFGADRVMVVNKRPKYRELKVLASELGRVDLVIHLTEQMKLKDLYFLASVNAPNVASLDDDIERVNIKMSTLTSNMLFHDKYRYLLKKLSIPDIDDSYIIPYEMSENKYQHSYSLLCNFFGSTEHKSIKIERAVSTLNCIMKLYPKLVIGILHSPATIEKAKEIVAHVGDINVQLAENVNTINDAINCVASSQVVLTVDTSIVHIATGLKKKTIAIYPERKDIFNCWLPTKSGSTSILLSSCAGVNVDVNNYSDDEVIEYLHSNLK